MSKTLDQSGLTSGTPEAIAIIGKSSESTSLERLVASHGSQAILLAPADDGGLAAAEFSRLAGCAVVADARVGDGPGRLTLLQSLEASLPAEAILLAVVRGRSLAGIAKSLTRPGNFAGLGFPVAGGDLPLVEIVRFAQTSGSTLQQLVDLLGRFGARTLVVQDSPGFFVTRVSQAYLNESMALLGEGVPAAQVEKAALDNGLEAGPLALLDRMSLRLSDELLHQELDDLEREAAEHHQHASNDAARATGHDHDHDHDHDHGHGHGHDHGHDHGHAHDHGRAHTHDHAVKSKRMPEPAVYVMEKMAHGFRRMGREAGAGFYEYEDDGSASLWSGLKAFERRATRLPAEDIRDRLLFAQALETVRCLEEGVVDSLADVETALVQIGCFPAAGGGPAAFVDGMGVQAFVDRARFLADAYGVRFSPPALLVDLATRGQTLAERGAAGTAGR
jgi:3-hydroxyacyl-CoA dehydrogenase / enoyl-CoA hydratase / 3-hydroxybutyryl-CoA epimerase